MPSPYDRSDRGSSRGHRVWGHWVPLVLTVTVATVGLAAWVWSQRSEDDHDHNDVEPVPEDLDYENADYGDNPPYGASRGDGAGAAGSPRVAGGDSHPGETSYGTTAANQEGSAGWGARMSGALRRTPSPQQFLDTAGKTVAASVAAASAAVGSALSSIREEDKAAYADHETWSEEADAKRERPAKSSQAGGAGGGASGASGRRKTVAIVVSADGHSEDVDADEFHEHASILSHIPSNIDFSKVKLFILIYAPGLKDQSGDSANDLPPISLTSSYSNIGHDQAQSPGDEAKSPLLAGSSTNPAYSAVYSQALGLVEKESMVMPFTTANGHIHMLRHLEPEVVYLQESLAGDNGSVVTQLQTWLRHDVILVVGAESGHGGLADSESEAEKPEKAIEKWWHREDRVGRGRGVVVVDGMRVHDDWARRVQGKE